VFIFETLHHLPNPVNLCKEFHRVLKPHGRLAFAEPGIGHGEQFHAHEEVEHGILEEELHLYRLYQTLRSAGFTDLELLVPPVSPRNHALSVQQFRHFLLGASWLVPADLFRIGIVTAPLGVAYKNIFRVTSRNPRSLTAEIRCEKDQFTAKESQSIEIRLTVKNVGNTDWLVDSEDGIGQVTIAISHIDSGRKRISEYSRIPLPHDVGTGETVRIETQIDAPSVAGNYLLEIDLVDEGICWFKELGS